MNNSSHKNDDDFGFVPDKKEGSHLGFVPDENAEGQKIDTSGIVHAAGEKLSELGHSAMHDLPGLGAMAGGSMGFVAGGPPGAIAGSALGGYAGAAVKNAYNTAVHPEEAPKTDEEYITDPLKHAAYGIIGEGVGQQVGKAVGKGADLLKPHAKKVYDVIKDRTGKAIDWGMKKGGKIIHSMPERMTQEYIDRQGNISARPTDEIAHDIQGLHDNSKESVNQAEKHLQASKENVRTNADFYKDKHGELKDQLANQKFQAGVNAGDANLKFSNAAQTTKEALKSVHVRDLINPIQDAIKKLKEEVTEASVKSYEILGDHEGTVGIGPLRNVIKKGINDLKFRGQLLTGTDSAASRELEGLLDRIMNIEGSTITYPEAKFILQRLDQDTHYNPNAGAFEAVANSIKQQARRTLDQLVKNAVPAYRDQMLKVEAMTKLLKEASDQFGTPELALSRLQNISSVKGRNLDFEILKKLGQETQRDFSAPIQRFIDARDTLSTPSRMTGVLSGLPEHAKKEAAQSELKRLSNPQMKKVIKERLSKSSEAQGLNDSKAKLLNGQGTLQNAEASHVPYAPFGQNAVQARMKALIGARNYSAKKQFSALDKASGKQFTKEINDRAILDAFEKTDTAGSRKTVFGKALGKAIGMGIGAAGGGAIGGHTGAATGAAIGFGMDKYSGQVLRSILNRRINVTQGTQFLENQFGKYAHKIAEAAQRSPEALAQAISELAEMPDFQAMFKTREE